MSYKVVALLDRPSPSSCGMVPFVAQKEGAGLLICGLKRRPSDQLDWADLGRLVAEGHALPVKSGPLPADAPLERWVAGWFGREFEKRLAEVDGPKIEIPRSAENVPGEGRFWTDSSVRVYGLLEDRLREAFWVSLTEGKAELADLMAWVLPDHVETRAAIYFTRASERERDEELRWWVRLAEDSGKPVTKEDLVKSFQAAAEPIIDMHARSAERKSRASA